MTIQICRGLQINSEGGYPLLVTPYVGPPGSHSADSHYDICNFNRASCVGVSFPGRWKLKEMGLNVGTKQYHCAVLKNPENRGANVFVIPLNQVGDELIINYSDDGARHELRVNFGESVANFGNDLVLKRKMGLLTLASEGQSHSPKQIPEGESEWRDLGDKGFMGLEIGSKAAFVIILPNPKWNLYSNAFGRVFVSKEEFHDFIRRNVTFYDNAEEHKILEKSGATKAE